MCVCVYLHVGWTGVTECLTFSEVRKSEEPLTFSQESWEKEAFLYVYTLCAGDLDLDGGQRQHSLASAGHQFPSGGPRDRQWVPITVVQHNGSSFNSRRYRSLSWHLAEPCFDCGEDFMAGFSLFRVAGNVVNNAAVMPPPFPPAFFPGSASIVLMKTQQQEWKNFGPWVQKLVGKVEVVVKPLCVCVFFLIEGRPFLSSSLFIFFKAW